MAKKSNPGIAVGPSIVAARAIELLNRQITRAHEIISLPYTDPQVQAWENTTENILTQAYGAPAGQPHRNLTDFAEMDSGLPFHFGMTDAEMQQHHVSLVSRRIELLKAVVEQLHDLAQRSSPVATSLYDFHPEIERVSGGLLRDGHYKQAALEAYIFVIEAVKEKSQLNADGDDLMNRAFGSDNRTPSIQINELQTSAQRDEQRAFMYLFKGIVGLRNSKAHSNRLFADPSRAHEYLALASLLLRILETVPTP